MLLSRCVFCGSHKFPYRSLLLSTTVLNDILILIYNYTSYFTAGWYVDMCDNIKVIEVFAVGLHGGKVVEVAENTRRNQKKPKEHRINI